MKLIKLLTSFIPSVTAEAHCDIPCDIYEPTPAKIAAMTVLRMVLQLGEFRPPQDPADQKAALEYLNATSRRIAVKEEHAKLCKHELSTLWSDFFKPEHLAKFPELHNIFWKALKLCSKNKQSIDVNTAKELIAAVDQIAKIFYETKGAPERYEAYKIITDKLF